MSESLFFYDLETTGLKANQDRIMQFAGQRTDAEFNLVGDPVNIIVKQTPDMLPAPEAVLVTGITPQKTLEEGVTEAEFLNVFHKDICTKGTTFIGFNSVSFDDEFMRNVNYRNFYDPYEWHWDKGNSRWDILDLTRMTRALRPDGIEWPFNAKGEPANKLELIAEANGLVHENAHDALSDVLATIAVAKMINEKQPRLLDYQFNNRSKASLKEFFKSNKDFLYTSGTVSKEFMHTTAMTGLAKMDETTVLAYDLRFDPAQFMDMSLEQIVESMRPAKDRSVDKLPIKTIKLNKCPAVAPMAIFKDSGVQERIKLDQETIDKNIAQLNSDRGNFTSRIITALEIIDKEKQELYKERDLNAPAEQQMYSDFIGIFDKTVSSRLRHASPDEIGDFANQFHDQRLRDMVPLYKARNYPKSLTSDEMRAYEDYRREQLLGGGEKSRAAKYFKRLGELANKENKTLQEDYLLEELKLYGESILPEDVDD